MDADEGEAKFCIERLERVESLSTGIGRFDVEEVMMCGLGLRVRLEKEGVELLEEVAKFLEASVTSRLLVARSGSGRRLSRSWSS
jgi:hypothetical protein